MDRVLLPVGRLAGVVGFVLCLMAVGVRAAGTYWLAGVPAVTLLLGGMASLLVGCFCLLAVLVERSAER